LRYILYVTILVLTLLNTSLVHAKDVHYYLTAGMNGIVRMHDGKTLPVWGFQEDGHPMWSISVPGPTIRAREGDHVFLHFWNMSMLPHTIHPHGLDVPQDMDGVPQTSFEVPMMGSYTYDFIAPHAGSYANHCHVHTVLHLQMGMYGAVVIDSPDSEQTVWEDGPAYDIERIWVTGEFDSYWHIYAGDHCGGPGMMGDNCDEEINDFPYHDYNPDYFIVNGKSGSDIHNDTKSSVKMDVDQTFLLRIMNVGGYLPHRFLFNGLPATLVSSDGRPLPVQETVKEFTVYPGERYSVIIKPDMAGNYQVEIEYLSIYDESVQGKASVPIVVRSSAASTTSTTTTTTVLTTTSTIPSPIPTTTTSVRLTGSCLVKEIYGEDSKEVKMLRYFRDNVLSKTPKGRGIISSYYGWSPVIVRAIEEDEEFKQDVKEMIDGVLEMIE
jgi:FtsP/CotA-like multicopper oxidase with cupredoxin domain